MVGAPTIERINEHTNQRDWEGRASSRPPLAHSTLQKNNLLFFLSFERLRLKIEIIFNRGAIIFCHAPRKRERKRVGTAGRSDFAQATCARPRHSIGRRQGWYFLNAEALRWRSAAEFSRVGAGLILLTPRRRGSRGAEGSESFNTKATKKHEAHKGIKTISIHPCRSAPAEILGTIPFVSLCPFVILCVEKVCSAPGFPNRASAPMPKR